MVGDMKKKKSSSYQYKIVEIGFDQSKFNNFSAERGIGQIVMENAVDDRIAALKESLLDHLYEIINGNYLTEHQKKILLNLIKLIKAMTVKS